MDNLLIFSEDGLTVIGCNKSFEGELIVPDGVEHIANCAFQDSKATYIHIPDSVKSIGDCAFSGCRGLTSVTIPNSVTGIGDSAFATCSGLTSITIPSSVTWIRGAAFYGCSGLISVTIPHSVTSIEESAFSGCSCLTSITIPSSVTSIENGAFRECKNLKEIIIPNSVISIGDYAFAYCSALISITIPDSVISIGANAFMETGWYNNQDDGLLYLDNWLLGYKGDKPTGELTIAEGTNRIGDAAFAHCSTLTSVTISSSVTSIGEEAFDDCSSLTSVTITNSVASIRRAAFSRCCGLTSVTIPSSVTNIGDYAFARCSDLTSITILGSALSIGYRTFYQCENLKKIIICKGTRAKFEKILPDQKDKLVEQEQYPEELTNDGKLLLFFDTETIGLPSDWNAPSSDVTNWPRIVQISWIKSNIRGQIISKQNYIVKPNGFSIPSEVSQIHGITTERALEEGVKLNIILDHFLRDLQNVSYVIGHNISFDKNVVEAELYRIGGERHLDEVVIDKYVDMLETKPTICTMLSSTNYCRIPCYDNGYKWPKLSELYDKLFNKELVDAHDSSVDIQATFDCFWKLVELGVISSVDAEGTIIGKETPVHHNKMRFTSFNFNSSVYSGYGEPTSDFIKRLYTREWKLFVSNETPQDLLFNYPNTLHVMDNGRGRSGTYTLKDKDSLLLSIDGESFYLHCVYYNEEIIIFQFDQSNEHLLLYPKGFAFSSVRDIHEYLDRVKQYVNSQRKKARKEKAIELQNRVESLIKDITRTDVEVSDKRVESLKAKLKQLRSIIGSEDANQYQPIIDKAIEANKKKKLEIEEKTQKDKEEKKRKLSILLVVLFYVVLWAIAAYFHFSYEWDVCHTFLGWTSAIIFFVSLQCAYIPIPQLSTEAKVIHMLLCFMTIAFCLAYDDDWHKFRNSFSQDFINPKRVDVYSENNFDAQSGDRYLSKTIFHFFDYPAKKYIEEKFNSSYNLYELNQYLSNNKSGFYVKEAKAQLYFASDILCSKAETLGDWRYIIAHAPTEYKENAEKNYAHLDSIVWNDEELAYRNTKSLGTKEACEKFMSLYGDGKYGKDISILWHNQIQLDKMLEEVKRYKK